MLNRLGFIAVGVLWATHVHCAVGAVLSIKGSFSYYVPIREEDRKTYEKQFDELRKQLKGLPKFGDVPNPAYRDFSVDMDECQWQVTIRLRANTNFHSFIYQYDGHTMVCREVRPAIDGALEETVFLEESEVPATITTAAGEIPWLAFASGCYLKQLTNDYAMAFRTVTGPDVVYQRFQVPIKVMEMATLPPYVPVQIFYKSEEIPLDSNGRRNGNVVPWESAKAGYISGQYMAGPLTNFAGFFLPTSFEYRLFGSPKESADLDNRVATLIVRGATTNISINKGSLDLSLPSRFSVNDRRSGVLASRYVVTNGVIPTKNASVPEAARKRAARVAAAEPLAGRMRLRIMFFGGVFVLLAFPCGVLVYRRCRRE